jgi:alkyl hydroperoxide reductase subunit F
VKDLLIIGGGPAGLTAAIYSARKQVDFALITTNIGGQALWGSNIQNYLGYTMISGIDLVKKFNEHVGQFDIEKYFDEVTEIKKIKDYFTVRTKNGKSFDSRTVIFATGKRPRLLMVPGEREFHGRGVTYCSTCDAPLFSGQPVMVVGGGNAGLEAVLQASELSPKVYLITNEGLTGDSVTQKKIKEKNNVEIVQNATC